MGREAETGFLVMFVGMLSEMGEENVVSGDWCWNEKA